MGCDAPRVTVLATLGLALASALVPLINIEAALVAAAALGDAPAWVLALAATVGQMAGKMLFYALGAGLISHPRLRRRSRTSDRWTARMAAVTAWAERRPWGPTAVILVSSFTGLPPFAVTSVLAGTLRMRWWLFLASGSCGRFLRFLAVVGAGGELLDRWT